jgi:hypothetical protein
MVKLLVSTEGNQNSWRCTIELNTELEYIFADFWAELPKSEWREVCVMISGLALGVSHDCDFSYGSGN